MSKRSKNINLRFALGGFLFGLVFPIIGTVIKLASLGWSMNGSNITLVHTENPLLQIIDLAPFILMMGGIILARPYIKLQNRQGLLKIENIQIDEQLQGALQRLEQKNDYLQQVAYFMTHDLKSTLRGISSLTEFLKEEEDPIQVEKYNSMLKQRISRMDMLYDSLLEFLRKSQQPNQLTAIDHDSFLNDFVKKTKFEGLQITNENNGVILNLDQQKLHDIYSELVKNAVIHSAGGEVQVKIKAENLGASQRILIKDNGPGIEPKYRQKIFKLNTKLERRDDKETSGMGLAFVKMLVNDMEGEIEVVDGEGATFELKFPNR